MGVVTSTRAARDAQQLGDHQIGIENVLDHLGGEHEVEAAVGERQPCGLGGGDGELIEAARLRERGGREIDPPNVGAETLAHDLHEVALGAADVEHAGESQRVQRGQQRSLAYVVPEGRRCVAVVGLVVLAREHGVFGIAHGARVRHPRQRLAIVDHPPSLTSLRRGSLRSGPAATQARGKTFASRRTASGFPRVLSRPVASARSGFRRSPTMSTQS